MSAHWTQEQIQILRDNAGKISRQEIALLLGKSVGSVSTKANALNIRLVVRPRTTVCKEELICAICGKRFTPIRRRENSRFCGNICTGKYLSATYNKEGLDSYQKALTLLAQGCTQAEVGRHLSLSRGRIWQFVQRQKAAARTGGEEAVGNQE